MTVSHRPCPTVSHRVPDTVEATVSDVSLPEGWDTSDGTR